MVIFMEPRLLVNNYNENIIKLIQSSEGSERFERKLPLKKGQSIYLRNKLINKGFSNLHETRIITSIYFDTEDYLFARQNINGENLRVKPRVRYYNSDNKNSVLEFKLKQNYNSYKKIINNSILINPSNLNNLKFFEKFSCELLGLKLLPSSIVTYRRQYYKYKNIRLTIDDNLYVKKFLNRNFLNENLMQLNLEVIEFKYKKNFDNFFRKNFSYFFDCASRSHKCSKYIHSIIKTS
tara:strand:- start:405 stop:1115 length:711 start_codon:yes stop_codon:yes gene_type:complete